MTLYFDNSATSWPKPKTVIKAMKTFMDKVGASPGRSAHRLSHQAAREVFETREMIADLFHADDSERVIFTYNATYAINLVLKGFIRHGDHVIVSSLEHNSVLRPLNFLKSEGIAEYSIVGCKKNGSVNIDELKNSFKPNTRLVICIHGSNVFGSVNPLGEIGSVCRNNNVPLMVDAAQTAGFIPVNMKKDNIAMLIFTGHKKLYGPSGIGGICFSKNIDIHTTIQGGTGSKSELEVHPNFYPDKLEAGTPNTIGIVGLKAGISYIQHIGIDKLKKNQLQLTEYFVRTLCEMDEVMLFRKFDFNSSLPIVSLNIKNMVCSDIATQLDRDFNIQVRAGLHCAPQAHKTFNTFPLGTVRFSIGCFNTEKDILFAIQAIKKIIKKNNVK